MGIIESCVRIDKSSTTSCTPILSRFPFIGVVGFWTMIIRKEYYWKCSTRNWNSIKRIASVLWLCRIMRMRSYGFPRQAFLAGLCTDGNGSQAFTCGHGIALKQPAILKDLGKGIVFGSPSTIRLRFMKEQNWRRSSSTCTIIPCVQGWCSTRQTGSGVRPGGMSGGNRSESQLNGWNKCVAPVLEPVGRSPRRKVGSTGS